MKDVFPKIENMRRQQQEVAGILFPSLSTPETWLELMRWMLREKNENFPAQMLEVAAMASWALQVCEEEMEENEGFTADESWEKAPFGVGSAARFSWTPK